MASLLPPQRVPQGASPTPVPDLSGLPDGSEDRRRPRTFNSSTGDTPVLTADGSTKPIRDVHVGDHVTATDPQTAVAHTETVTATIHGHGHGLKHLITLTITTGHGKTTGRLTATDNHPFWVPDEHQWVNAGQLRPGVWLQTSHFVNSQSQRGRRTFWTEPETRRWVPCEMRRSTSHKLSCISLSWVKRSGPASITGRMYVA
jgi:hypothetical protein